jgi:hypothetical protein
MRGFAAAKDFCPGYFCGFCAAKHQPTAQKLRRSCAWRGFYVRAIRISTGAHPQGIHHETI